MPSIGSTPDTAALRLARLLAWWIALLVILALPRSAHADPSFTATCEAALPKEQVDELFAAMRAAEGTCRLERVDTTTFRTVIEWAADDQQFQVLLGPRACLLEPSHEGADLAFHAPAELARACPEAATALREFVGETREVAQISTTHEPRWSSEPEQTTFADPRIAAGIAWIGVLVLALMLGWRRSRAAGEPEDHAWVKLATAGFVLGLLARFMVEPSLGNWYGAFLPAQGWGEQRFGASAAILQALVRAIVPWNVEVAFGLARVVGALAVPLVIVLVRRLGGSLAAGALAGILLALAPIPVRLSASSSEHLLAATLALAAWVTWLRTASDPSPLPRVLALLLVWLAVMTRVDCLPQLALIPLWTTLGEPIGARARDGLPLGRRLVDAAWFGACLAAMLVHGWLTIVLASNHPGPDIQGIVRTIELLFTQFWIAMIEPPHWLTPTCFVLVVLGMIASVILKRWRLLVVIVASVVLMFVPLGRNLSHDGLTGARYFVLLMPLLAVVASVFVELLGRWLPPPRQRPIAIASLTIYAALEALAAQPGWRQEYTFQAEYRVLAAALREHASELEGCTLWYVRPRQTTGEADLDCCLWPANSPLSLIAPDLRFRSMPLDRDPDDGEGCQLYYEGSVCDLDPAQIDLSPIAVARILDQCERLRQHAGEREIVGEGVTEVTLNPRFHGRPWLRLTARGLE